MVFYCFASHQLRTGYINPGSEFLEIVESSKPTPFIFQEDESPFWKRKAEGACS